MRSKLPSTAAWHIGATNIKAFVFRLLWLFITGSGLATPVVPANEGFESGVVKVTSFGGGPKASSVTAMGLHRGLPLASLLAGVEGSVLDIVAKDDSITGF
jgi:hypothetical protein